MALDILELDVAIHSNRLEQLLDVFQLQHVRAQPASSLSGEERRRCEVARALVAHPAILMLDEPFRGLDPMSVLEVSRAVASLRGQGIGVLVSDYDLHDLIDLIDRAYLLHDGRIIFSGTAAELLADPDVRHLYLEETDPEERAYYRVRYGKRHPAEPEGRYEPGDEDENTDNELKICPSAPK